MTKRKPTLMVHPDDRFCYAKLRQIYDRETARGMVRLVPLRRRKPPHERCVRIYEQAAVYALLLIGLDLRSACEAIGRPASTMRRVIRDDWVPTRHALRIGTTYTRAVARDMWVAGRPVKDICAYLQCDWKSVDKIRAREKWPRRTRLLYDHWHQAKALWQQGWKIGEIAAAIGRSRSSVVRITRALGCERRNAVRVKSLSVVPNYGNNSAGAPP